MFSSIRLLLISYADHTKLRRVYVCFLFVPKINSLEEWKMVELFVVNK